MGSIYRILAHASAMTSAIKRKMRHVPRLARVATISSLAIAFMLVACTPAAPAQESVRVQVRTHASVTGDQIVLKDIATVTAPAGMQEQIGRISLGPAPRPGKDKKISGRRLRSILQSGKRLPADALVIVPDSIRVTRAHQALSSALLKQAFYRYIAGELDGADFRISRFTVRGTNLFPVGNLALSVTRRSKKDLAGPVSLRATVRLNGGVCGRLTLSGWVDRFVPVVVARQDMPRHRVLTAADLVLKTVSISKAPSGLVTDIAPAVGKRLRTRVSQGDCLNSRMLENPPLVEKGDRIKILAKSGTLRVSTLGIAKGSGGSGDQIPVENVTTNKTVMGRVTSASTVEVLF